MEAFSYFTVVLSIYSKKQINPAAAVLEFIEKFSIYSLILEKLLLIGLLSFIYKCMIKTLKQKFFKLIELF